MLQDTSIVEFPLMAPENYEDDPVLIEDDPVPSEDVPPVRSARAVYRLLPGHSDPRINEADRDPSEESRMLDVTSRFYEDLRQSSSYWVYIKVTFYRPPSNSSNMYLCLNCVSSMVFYVTRVAYNDYVSFFEDCYRDAYFCSLCTARLYEIIDP